MFGGGALRSRVRRPPFCFPKPPLRPAQVFPILARCGQKSLLDVGHGLDHIRNCRLYATNSGPYEQADRYRAVTAEQVNEIISERFGEENRANLIYVPREGVESERVLAAAGTG